MLVVELKECIHCEVAHLVGRAVRDGRLDLIEAIRAMTQVVGDLIGCLKDEDLREATTDLVQAKIPEYVENMLTAIREGRAIDMGRPN